MTEPKPPSNAVLIVGVIAGLVVLVCGSGAAGLYLWARANADDLKESGLELHGEATAFGEASSDRACLEEGFARAAPCSDLNIRCNVKASVFLSFCLEAAPATGAFCEGVPARSDLLAFTKYSTQACAERGMMGHQGCAQVLQRLGDHCAQRDEAVPSP